MTLNAGTTAGDSQATAPPGSVQAVKRRLAYLRQVWLFRPTIAPNEPRRTATNRDDVTDLPQRSCDDAHRNFSSNSFGPGGNRRMQDVSCKTASHCAVPRSCKLGACRK